MGEVQQHRTADHHFRQLRLGGLSYGHGANHPATPKDGDAIRDRENLIELMADEDNGLSLFFQASEVAEQLLDFLRD